MGDYCDVMCFHPYGDDNSQGMEPFAAHVSTYNRLMKEAKVAPKPIWDCESGTFAANVP